MGNNNCGQCQTRSVTMTFGSSLNKNTMMKMGTKFFTKRGIKSTYLKTTQSHPTSNSALAGVSCKIGESLHVKSIHKYVEKISVLRSKKSVWGWDILIEEAILTSPISYDLNQVIPNDVIDIIKEFSINDPECYHYKSYISKEYRFKNSNYKILMDNKSLCHQYQYTQSTFWSLNITLLGSGMISIYLYICTSTLF